MVSSGYQKKERYATRYRPAAKPDDDVQSVNHQKNTFS